MSQLRTDILIAMRADASGAEAARASLLGIKSAASQVNGLLALGGLTLGAAGLAAFVRRGVEFNATVETAEVGLAALLRQFQPGRFSSFADALVESRKAVVELKKEAASSPATFKQLLDGLQATAGAAFAAGIPLERQIGLINRISQAGATLGLKGDQIPQEARALFTGAITANAALAKSLGITPADVAAAKASAGGLFDFLNKKLAAFSEASPYAAETLMQKASNLDDILDALAATIAGPLTEAMKAGATEISEAVAALTDADIRGIADALAKAAAGAVALAKGLIAAAPAAKEIALAAAALVLASKAYQASQTVGALAEGIAARRAGRAAMQGPDLNLFAAFDLEVKKSLNSLAGFTEGLAKAGALAASFNFGYYIGQALDRTFDVSGKVDALINGPSTLAEKRKTRRLEPAEELQFAEQGLLTAKAGTDRAAFDSWLKFTQGTIEAIRKQRPKDSEANALADRLNRVLGDYAREFADKLAAKSAAESAERADAEIKSRLAAIRKDAELRLRIANAIADAEPDAVSQAKAKARAGIEKLVTDPDKRDEYKRLGLGTTGDPAGVLAAAREKAHGELYKTQLAPRKFTDEQKEAALANFNAVADLEAPVRAATKARADEFAAASQKLEESIKTLGETAEQTARRHLDEATRAIAATAPGTLDRVNAEQAAVEARGVLEKGPKPAGFSPAIFADTLTRIGGSLAAPAPLSASPSAAPAVADYAKTTAIQSEQQTVILKRIEAAVSRKNGGWN